MSKNDKNAKDELIGLIDHYNLKIVGAIIQFGDYNDNDIPDKFILSLLYTEDEYNDFLKYMDREYYSGYGGQELFGTVVCEDGVWLDRYEYDGSESWQMNKYPKLGDMFGEKLALKYYRKLKLDEIEKIGE